MQRISVDLPDPDGPQMTIFSPRATSRSMSRSTWKCPYHLLTRENVMMGSVAGIDLVSTRTRVQVALDPAAVARHREAADEVDRGDEELPFEEELPPVGVAERELQCTGQVV